MAAAAGMLDERRITGRTKVITLLADPVDHVVGTEVVTAFFRARGIDLVCVPIHVASSGLASVVDALRHMRNVVGSGVTIPHKIAIADLLDGLTARAERIGSVNYVRRDGEGRLYGDNVDGAGFVVGAQAQGIDLKGLKVLQYGAGGAGRSVAFALAEAGVEELAIANRHPAVARQLADAVAAALPGTNVRVADRFDPRCDMLVNTTSVGLNGTGQDLFDLSLLRPGMIVADIVLVPSRTRLLDAAEAAGCITLYGRAMLDGQMALAAQFLQIGPE